MNAELEKWIQENKTQDCEPESSMGMGFGSTFSVSEDKLRALFDGKALVPVDKITTVARDVDYSPLTNRHTPFLRISFAYDDYDSRDEFAAVLAASQEQGK